MISFVLRPQIHKNYNGAHIQGMHSDVEVLTRRLQSRPGMHWSGKLQVNAEFTETCPLAACWPVILSFQTGMGATLHNYMCLCLCGLFSPSSGVPV